MLGGGFAEVMDGADGKTESLEVSLEPAVPDAKKEISRWCAKRVRASGWLLGNPQATPTWMVWYPVAPLGSVRCTTAVWV